MNYRLKDLPALEVKRIDDIKNTMEDLKYSLRINRFYDDTIEELQKAIDHLSLVKRDITFNENFYEEAGEIND
jgi:hypothetical protein